MCPVSQFHGSFEHEDEDEPLVADLGVLGSMQAKDIRKMFWSSGSPIAQEWATHHAPELSKHGFYSGARLSLNSGIETADSADFTDFEGVIGGRTYESLRGKSSGH